MPAFSWPSDPGPPISDFEKRHANPEAGALLQWARLSVEALHYLDDVDATFGATLLVPGHATQVVELAHARWATGTCITALDLAAAALGRALGHHMGKRELDLGSFVTTVPNPSKAGLAARSAMPLTATQWVDDVLKDPVYVLLQDARHALAHRRLPQHLTAGFGGHLKRLELQVAGTTRVSVRQLVTDARDLATTQIVGLVGLLPSL